MKIDTAVCKKHLEKLFGKGNWKRVSKKQDGTNTIRKFSNGADHYMVISVDNDSNIIYADKMDREDVPNGESKALKPDYKSSKGILQALSKLHPIFIQWLETQFDPDNCGSFKEYMENSDGTVFCDLDGCIEWVKEVHGINIMYDEEAVKKGSALIEQHMKDNVPSDFPYIIQTEDYNVLWKPGQAHKVMSEEAYTTPSPSSAIDRIMCWDEDHEAEFMVCTEDGTITVDKNGIVTDSYDQKMDEGEHVSLFKSKGIFIDQVLGNCMTCEDEASIKVHFKDGTVIDDEEEAFFKAFGLKPSKSAEKQEEEAQYAKEYKAILDARTPEQVYVDENMGKAMEKLQVLPEKNVFWLVSKYMKGYKGNLLVSPTKMFDGREVVLSSEYLRAYLVNERKYELIKDIMDIV